MPYTMPWALLGYSLWADNEEMFCQSLRIPLAQRIS